MANNSVHKGDRIDIVSFEASHKAGDLVCEKGFFGVVEEDVVAGKRGYIICGEVWRLRRVPANTAMGVKLFALPTALATTLPLAAAATTGHVQVGRTEATANSSAIGRVLLFHPNDY